MSSQSAIHSKLTTFRKKYYLDELIKGAIFFIGLALFCFLLIVLTEYFFWLKPSYRFFLFLSFIFIEVFLFLFFICLPIFKLLGIAKGIDDSQASILIGKHFSEVDDKLINFIQLQKTEPKTELVLASLKQRASDLTPIPFDKAIDFKLNFRYLYVVLFPSLFLLILSLINKNEALLKSFYRVLDYNTAYSVPAPFDFVVLNKNLTTQKNKLFCIRLLTKGAVIPEKVRILFNKKEYIMDSYSPGIFEFKVLNPTKNESFYFQANGFVSKSFVLKVFDVPTIFDLEIKWIPPSYLDMDNQIIRGTGNATVPEGALVSWKVIAQATHKVSFETSERATYFSKKQDIFLYSKRITKNTDYTISACDSNLMHYEKQNYSLTVIQDQYPSISVNFAPDNLKLAKNYLLGKVKDDYGLSKLQVAYYKKGDLSSIKREKIDIKLTSSNQFIFSFPSNLLVQQGASYYYFFEVFDNDALHHFKKATSQEFSFKVPTLIEAKDFSLLQEKDDINKLSKVLAMKNNEAKEIDKLDRMIKSKEEFDYKDQQKINSFVSDQEQKENQLKEMIQKLQNHLKETDNLVKDEMAIELEKRLNRVMKESEENQKLLSELEKWKDKMDDAQGEDKMGKYRQARKNQNRNLAQLLELTKKAYIEKKASVLAEQLKNLSQKQEDLRKIEKGDRLENQQQVNESFQKIWNDIADWRRDGAKLKSPIEIPNLELKGQDIDQELKQSLEKLGQKDFVQAGVSQKKAAVKMKNLATDLSQTISSIQMKEKQEDIHTLRQVVDNLLAFSLAQEDLMEQFKKAKQAPSAFSKSIRVQQNLKQQFKHIDDTLFVISLRNPKMEESITKEIGNIDYNINKVIETIGNLNIAKSIAHQQYVIASSNKIADKLSNMLFNMQMSLSESGGGDIQLDDVIKKQEKIEKKITELGETQGKQSGNKNQQGGVGEQSESIMQIYEEQKELRKQLQKELERKGLANLGKTTLDEMKRLEREILNRGFTGESKQVAKNLQPLLLKLTTALQEYDLENKRQSSSAKKSDSPFFTPLPKGTLEYLNGVEILSRQSLPLQPNINKKVRHYFNKQ